MLQIKHLILQNIIGVTVKEGSYIVGWLNRIASVWGTVQYLFRGDQWLDVIYDY